MSLATMRQAVADAITTGCPPWRCLAYVPDQINPPMMVFDFEVGDQMTYGPVGSTKHVVTGTVQAWAQRESERANQELLDKLRDPTDTTSLWQVLEASTVGDYVRVRTAGKVGVATANNVEYLLVEFDLEIAL